MDEKKTSYRKYTEEFKLEALELLKSSGKSAGQIERDLGITPGLLVKWRDRYQVISKGINQVHLEASDFEAAKREIKHLQRRLAEVEEEREILKKTINIFSRASQLDTRILITENSEIIKISEFCYQGQVSFRSKIHL